LTSREPTRAEIDTVVSQLRIRKGGSNKTEVAADCPSCGKPGKLALNTESGLWQCFAGSCGEAGSIFRLATLLGIRLRGEASRPSTPTDQLAEQFRQRSKLSRSHRGVARAKIERCADRALTAPTERDTAVLEYLAGRGFDRDTIEHFRLHATMIGGDGGPTAVGIPYLDGDDVVPLIKQRNIDTNDPSRRFRRYPTGGESPLFNRRGVIGRRRAVLVEAELDAISLWQLGVTDVCATSLGAKKEIPPDWLRDLEGVEEIVLWYDEDDAGQSAVEALSAQLGSYRCRVASIQAVGELAARKVKDANDILKLRLQGVDDETLSGWVRDVIDRAKGYEYDKIVSPSRYAEYIQGEIERGPESLGTPTGYTSLDKLLRGFRRSEVTLVTGHTGQGKTTFAHAVARGLAAKNTPVCVSSFENGPKSWVTKLLHARMGRPISTIRTDKDRETAYAALANIDQDPISIMAMEGSQNVVEVIEAMKWARYRLGIWFFVIDHMHKFSSELQGRNPTAHWDMISSKMFDASRALDCHIMLLAHPNGGVDKRVIPTHENIKGASSIKQDADNSITVWRPHDVTGSGEQRKIKLKGPDGDPVEFKMSSDQALIYVSKVRHDEGRQGAFVMDFQPRSLSYVDHGVAEDETPQNAVAETAAPVETGTWLSECFDGGLGGF
jgi:energy-coupling factor transporter ATP-binding protein EcfA2